MNDRPTLLLRLLSESRTSADENVSPDDLRSWQDQIDPYVLSVYGNSVDERAAGCELQQIT